jgi:phage tail-like protein
MKDGNGQPVLTFEVFDCLPIKLKAPSLNAKDGQVAIEEMQVTYGSFNVVPA